jgi:DHA3 family macrolide efflux protein-like MFS transporter
MQSRPAGPSFRTFLYLWASQGLSVFGSSLSFFAISVWLVTTVYPAPEQKAALASTLALISLAFAIPALALAPVAGVCADRYDKKRMMLFMDGGNAVVAALMATLVWTHHFNVPLLLVIAALHSSLAAFHGAAFDTAYPSLVSEQQLPRANGMMQTLWSAASILAPAVAAGLIVLAGTPFVMLVDVLTFVVAIMVLAFLAMPSLERAKPGPDEAKPSFWTEIKVGLQFLKERRELLWLLSMFAGANLLMAPIGLYLPLITRFTLASDWGARGFTYEGAFAVVDTFYSLGSVAGGLFISAWGGLKERRVWGVIVPLMVGGLMMVFLGLSRGLYLTAAILFCFTFGFPIANSHSQALWQSRTPRDKQGRVFAVRRVIAQVSSPLMTAVAGWLAGRAEPSVVIAIFGALLVGWGLFHSFNPRIHAADQPGLTQPLPEAASDAPAEEPAS